EQARELAPKIAKVLAASPSTSSEDKSGEKGRKGKKSSKGLPDGVEAIVEQWRDKFGDNLKKLREAAALNVGLPSPLFGRMVPSDPAANIDAPIHVAHAFTVHGEEAEGDYFTAVDDLKREEDDSGADTIQETELTSGLFYGYVVIDVPGLVSNLTGSDR